MKIVITIQCDNEAFGDYPSIETNYILRKIIDRIEYDCPVAVGNGFPIFDSNGNKVGDLSVLE